MTSFIDLTLNSHSRHDFSLILKRKNAKNQPIHVERMEFLISVSKFLVFLILKKFQVGYESWVSRQ